MSAHSFETIHQAIVPGGILVASLFGSAHCVGMCGGLVIGFARSAKDIALYHFGRLVSYMLLGAAAGALGGAAVNAPALRPVSWIASLAFGAVLVVIGARRLAGRPLHVVLPRTAAALLERAMSRVARVREGSAGVLALGALSALLPCGWLYTFVIGAAATGSGALGAGAMALFWLGTVPALSAAPLIFSKITGRLRAVTPRLSGALMLGLGLFSLSLHAAGLFQPVRAKPAGISQERAQIQVEDTCPLHSLHGSH